MSLWIKSQRVIIENESHQALLFVVMFIAPYKMATTFESVDEIHFMWCCFLLKLFCTLIMYFCGPKSLLSLSFIDCCSWMPSDYVDPCTPPSPSISLVHAYRDKQLVSVPCNLLVQGDVIVLGPGHSAPAQVQQVNRNSLE